MEYISVRETAEKWGLTTRMVIYHCTHDRIKDVKRISGVWLIPKDAAKPEDRRKGNGRKAKSKNAKEGEICR